MKPSDFKHIVKESLREAFYTKKVITEGIGKKISIDVYIVGQPKVTYPAFIGKNTIPHEKHYRISWFSPDMKEAEGHVDIDSHQFNKLMSGEQDANASLKISQFIEADRIHLNLDDDPQQLDEGIDGHKITVNYYGRTMPAILSKNTIPDEKPYRVSFFEMEDGEITPRGHFDLSKQEAEEVLHNRKFPDEVITLFKGISIQTVNGWPKQEAEGIVIEPLKEDVLNNNLLLLENSSREIDLWLENRNVIAESMNMVVSGVSYKRTDRLDELVNHLQDTVLSPVLKGITDPAKIDFFHKNSVGFYNMLSADGSYYEMQSGNPALGIINFYPAGIPSDMSRRIIMGILKQLKTMNIQWGALKREKSGAYKISDVIRIPIIANNSKKYEGPPELNFSNINSYQIFHNLLQFDGEHSFEMDAKELMERIETVLKHDRSWIDKNTIKRTDSDWPKAERDDTGEPVENPHLDVMNKITGDLGAGGARVIGMGLDAEGIEFRLQAIWKVAKWAVDHGHNKILVG